jgi:hypothetical protein
MMITKNVIFPFKTIVKYGKMGMHSQQIAAQYDRIIGNITCLTRNKTRVIMFVTNVVLTRGGKECNYPPLKEY